MARGDVAVMSISAALVAIVVAAITYSVVALDAKPDPSAMVTDDSSSWLVLTWAPSFCVTEPTNPGCTSGDAQRAGQTMLLHGLWPQPPDRRYCGLAPDVEETALPRVDLDRAVSQDLAATTVNSASLSRHEWYTHGTCSGVSPDSYFGDATALTREARSAFDPIFRDAAGARLTLNALRDRVDEELGIGAGGRVGLGCRKATGTGSLVVEVRLSLPPVVALRDGDRVRSLSELLQAAPPIPAQCRHGSVPA
ncbi:MAG: ribonuclease T(2) [Mycobacterium kyogaense]|uniref:ribonuclease T2 family protein n=1 Tax=Mycobacterium kyogaense TaxID=2212479 RepID=UPI002FF5F4F3